MTTSNHFTLLNLPTAFDIDAAALERAYFAFQRTHHPDGVARLSAEERAQSAQQSMDANAVYQTLKNPLKRALYLLELQGIRIEGHDAVKPGMDLLAEVMEWRERIEEAESPINRAVLREILESAQSHSEAAFAKAYAAKQWDVAAQAALRLQYCTKSLHELKLRK